MYGLDAHSDDPTQEPANTLISEGNDTGHEAISLGTSEESIDPLLHSAQGSGNAPRASGKSTGWSRKIAAKVLRGVEAPLGGGLHLNLKLKYPQTDEWTKKQLTKAILEWDGNRPQTFDTEDVLIKPRADTLHPEKYDDLVNSKFWREPFGFNDTKQDQGEFDFWIYTQHMQSAIAMSEVTNHVCLHESRPDKATETERFKLGSRVWAFELGFPALFAVPSEGATDAVANAEVAEDSEVADDSERLKSRVFQLLSYMGDMKATPKCKQYLTRFGGAGESLPGDGAESTDSEE